MKSTIAILLIFCQASMAQVDHSTTLYKTINKMDMVLFEEGFNQCNLNRMKEIISNDLEFYHDKGGFQNREQFIQAMDANICSTPERKPIRKLTPDSMQVYPMYNNGELYAAIQKGWHEFYIKEPNKELYQTGVAQFTQLWILNNKQWILKRVLSFDHKPVDKNHEKFNAHNPMSLFDTYNKINQLLTQHKIPSLAIGYINQGKLQQIRQFGKQTGETAVSYNSIYKVASLTKPVVALLTLKLIDTGKLALDEPLYQYYIDPDIAQAPELKLLTARIVLSHQTGLPNWRYLDEENKLKFMFKPGTQFSYSGEGFEFLRKALENKFNKGLEELAKEILFKPLDMKDTHFTWDKSMDESRYAQEHDETGKAIMFKKHQTSNAAANLLTTTEDYGKFMVHILNGAGLSEKLYKEMVGKQANVKEGVDFGLGWKIFPNLGSGEYALQHTGGDYGVKTIAILLPESKRGLLIFMNSENGMSLWSKIITEVYGKIGQKLIDLNIKEKTI